MKINFLMLVLLSLVVNFSIPFNANANLEKGKEGHGGQTVDVGGRPVLQDLVYETVCEWAPAESLIAKNKSWTQTLTELDSIHWFLAHQLSYRIKSLNVCKTEANLKQILNPKDKEGLTIFPYKTRQVAIRINNSIWLDLKIFNSMSPENQAYLMIHEISHDFLTTDLPEYERHAKITSFVAAIRKVIAKKFTLDQFNYQLAMNGVLQFSELNDLTKLKDDFLAAFNQEKPILDRARAAVRFFSQWPTDYFYFSKYIMSEAEKNYFHSLPKLHLAKTQEAFEKHDWTLFNVLMSDHPKIDLYNVNSFFRKAINQKDYQAALVFLKTLTQPLNINYLYNSYDDFNIRQTMLEIQAIALNQPELVLTFLKLFTPELLKTNEALGKYILKFIILPVFESSDQEYINKLLTLSLTQELIAKELDSAVVAIGLCNHGFTTQANQVLVLQKGKNYFGEEQNFIDLKTRTIVNPAHIGHYGANKIVQSLLSCAIDHDDYNLFKQILDFAKNDNNQIHRHMFYSSLFNPVIYSDLYQQNISPLLRLVKAKKITYLKALRELYNQDDDLLLSSNPQNQFLPEDAKLIKVKPGHNVLSYAIWQGDLTFFKELWSLVKKPTLAINTLNNFEFKYTLLEMAVRYGFWDIAQFLAQQPGIDEAGVHFATWRKTTKTGEPENGKQNYWTTLGLAIVFNQIDLVRSLKSQGLAPKNRLAFYWKCHPFYFPLGADNFYHIAYDYHTFTLNSYRTQNHAWQNESNCSDAWSAEKLAQNLKRVEILAILNQ